MSKTQYYCASTLDGYIAEADDTLDWLLKYEGSFEGEGVEPIKGSYDRFYEGVGALVMGSVTYEFILDMRARRVALQGQADLGPEHARPAQAGG